MMAAELARAAAGRLAKTPGWESRLLEAVIQDSVRGDATNIVREMETLARRHAVTGSDTIVCHEVLTALRLQTVACAAVEPASRARMEDLFQEARLGLARIGIDVERSRHEMLHIRVRTIERACHNVFGAGSLDDVVKLLEQHLPVLGIDAFSIGRFTGDGHSGDLELIARHASGVLRSSAKTLLANNLGMDASLDEEEAMVIGPLEFAAMPLGIAAFAWGAQIPEHYEHLREILGAALYATRFAKWQTR